MAYEEEIGTILRGGPSLSRSPGRLPRARQAPTLPRRDKVVTLLDKIRNVHHGNLGTVSAVFGNLNGIKTGRWRRPVDNKSGNLCVEVCLG